VGDPGTEQLERAPALIFEIGPEGALLAMSPEWTRLTGQPVAEALGRGWSRQVRPQEREVILALLRTTPVEEERTIDFQLKDAAGEWRAMRAWLRARVEGGVLAGFSGVATRFPPGSRELGREARLEALLSSLPDLLFQLDAQGRFVGYRGPEGASTFAPPDVFLGQPLTAVLPPPIAAQSLQAMARARETGEVQHFEFEMALPEGPRSFEARASPMATGEFLVLVRDITQLGQARAELIAAREAALRENRLKTQFLANVSHEIRTPLNGILGVTQLMRTWDLPRDAGEYLAVLESAGESLLSLVNEVLDLSKIESGRLELQVTTFDPAQVVGAAARAFLPLARKKGLTLDVQLALEGQGPVRGDAARLRQVVTNLVGNAVKFTAQGGIQVRLERPDPAGDLVRLVVRDTGPGIPADFRSRLFEPFAQADGSQRRHGGTGLGLSITRQLARLMGGDVRVESIPGQGAAFTTTVALPRARTTLPPEAPSWRPSPPPRPLKVLLAEDDPVNATMTSALLTRLGHAVELVGDGDLAVRRLREASFDLVFMDVEMPSLDGLEATRLIRRGEQGTGRHLPIVALTANAMKGDDLKCLSAGMDAYLPKPVTVEALTDVLSWFGSTG